MENKLKINTSKKWYYIPTALVNFAQTLGGDPNTMPQDMNQGMPMDAGVAPGQMPPEQTIPQEITPKTPYIDTARTQWYLEIPKSVTAIQYVGNNLQNMMDFCNNGRYRLVSMEDGTLKLSDSEGSVIINPGDYVASLKSGFSVYKADEFIKNYQYIEKDSDIASTNPNAMDAAMNYQPTMPQDPNAMPLDANMIPQQFSIFNFGLTEAMRNSIQSARRTTGNLTKTAIVGKVAGDIAGIKPVSKVSSTALGVFRPISHTLTMADKFTKIGAGDNEKFNPSNYTQERINNVLSSSYKGTNFSVFNFSKQEQTKPTAGQKTRDIVEKVKNVTGNAGNSVADMVKNGAHKTGEFFGGVIANGINKIRGVDSDPYAYATFSEMPKLIIHVMKKYKMCNDDTEDFIKENMLERQLNGDFLNKSPDGDIKLIDGDMGTDVVKDIQDDFKILLNRETPKQTLEDNKHSEVFNQ